MIENICELVLNAYDTAILSEHSQIQMLLQKVTTNDFYDKNIPNFENTYKVTIYPWSTF